jgi:hypothetical protein
MRAEGERRLAALAVVIFEINALPAIWAPELTHERIRPKRSWLLVERSQFVIVPEIRDHPGGALPLRVGRLVA